MKLGRTIGPNGERFWVVLDEATRTARQVRAAFEDWAPHAAAGDATSSAFDLAPTRLDWMSLQLVSPVNPGARIFGVGLNYQVHLARLGRLTPPPHTIAYIKPESAIVAPMGEIQYPAVTAELDFEVELVAVLGKPLDDEPHASACLIGYTVGNDISARDAGRQLGSLDLFTQKALDRTAPIGPWITTLDELGGPGQPELNMSLHVAGKLRQSDNTRNMIFPVDELLNFVNARIELRPGDLVFTGSTAGVGLEDGRFLKPGDEVVASIEGIGTLRNHVGAKRLLHPSRQIGRLGIPKL